MKHFVSWPVRLIALLGCFSFALLAAGPPTPKASPPVASSQTAAKPVEVSAKRSEAAIAPAPSQSKTPFPVSVGGDATIERAIQARFSRSKISTDGFTVKVQGGVAVLEGKTGVIQHKGTATRLAKRAGAKGVDNRIQISEAARERAIANLSHVRNR
jgi:BON domain